MPEHRVNGDLRKSLQATATGAAEALQGQQRRYRGNRGAPGHKPVKQRGSKTLYKYQGNAHLNCKVNPQNQREIRVENRGKVNYFYA